MNDGDSCWMTIMLGMIFFIMGFAAGESFENRHWENRTVDNAEYISAVRSEVIAKRAKEKIQASE